MFLAKISVASFGITFNILSYKMHLHAILAPLN